MIMFPSTDLGKYQIELIVLKSKKNEWQKTNKQK